MITQCPKCKTRLVLWRVYEHHYPSDPETGDLVGVSFEIDDPSREYLECPDCEYTITL